MTTPATTPADGELLQRIAENDPSWVLKYLEQNTRFDVPRIRELFEFAKAQATAMLATPSPGKAPEPVAWLAEHEDDSKDFVNFYEAVARQEAEESGAVRVLPLYALPGKAERKKLDTDLLATIREAAKTRAEGAITQDGRAVFINYGDNEQQMLDAADMACPHCGGSGHKGDASPGKADAEDAARWRTTVRYVAGRYSETGDQRFVLPGLFPVSMNIMQGSVAEHFTQAIDAAIQQERDKRPVCGAY